MRSIFQKLAKRDFFLDSSMVEHSAVNRVVVGSSPTRGAETAELLKIRRIRLRGQAVKTSPFHGGNTGSIPVGVIFCVGLHIRRIDDVFFVCYN